MMAGHVMKTWVKPDARRFESRRDYLFIVSGIRKAPIFLFFSGAGRCASTILRRNTRAAEKQKEGGVGVVGCYKQAIPTGFEESTGNQHGIVRQINWLRSRNLRGKNKQSRTRTRTRT